MPKRKRRSRQGREQRDITGAKKYEKSFKLSKTNNKKLLEVSPYYRNREIRSEVRKEKKRVVKPRLNERLTKTILTTVLPPCAKERERVKRAYFGYKRARPHVKKINNGGNRFSMRKCK